jgi:hypothetical protein
MTPLRPSDDGQDQSGTGGLSIVTVAAATASGIGVLGFVTFAGGVVLWARFREMGVQADRALAVVPSPEFVATGAEFLVPAMLIAAGLVLLMLGVDLGIRWMPWLKYNRRRRRLTSGWLTGFVAAVPQLIAAFVPGDGGVVGVGGLVVVAIVSAGAINLARSRTNVPVFSLVAFLAVGSFWLARAYVATANEPKVVPMAYSRKQPGGPTRVEYGYFVAETSDRIFYAAAPGATSEAPNELREFPRVETDDLEIGDLTAAAQAQQRASLLGFNLCYRLYFVKTVGTVPSAQTGKGCDIDTLRTYEMQAHKPLTPYPRAPLRRHSK